MPGSSRCRLPSCRPSVQKVSKQAIADQQPGQDDLGPSGNLHAFIDMVNRLSDR